MTSPDELAEFLDAHHVQHDPVGDTDLAEAR